MILVFQLLYGGKMVCVFVSPATRPGSYPVNQAHVLLGAAEVSGEVGDAERLVLTRVNPHLVLGGPRDPVEEDPERLPHGLLTN